METRRGQPSQQSAVAGCELTAPRSCTIARLGRGTIGDGAGQVVERSNRRLSFGGAGRGDDRLAGYKTEAAQVIPDAIMVMDPPKPSAHG
jgi:hypothetical protein